MYSEIGLTSWFASSLKSQGQTPGILKIYWSPSAWLKVHWLQLTKIFLISFVNVKRSCDKGSNRIIWSCSWLACSYVCLEVILKFSNWTFTIFTILRSESVLARFYSDVSSRIMSYNFHLLWNIAAILKPVVYLNNFGFILSCSFVWK